MEDAVEERRTRYYWSVLYAVQFWWEQREPKNRNLDYTDTYLIFLPLATCLFIFIFIGSDFILYYLNIIPLHIIHLSFIYHPSSIHLLIHIWSFRSPDQCIIPYPVLPIPVAIERNRPLARRTHNIWTAVVDPPHLSINQSIISWPWSYYRLLLFLPLYALTT